MPQVILMDIEGTTTSIRFIHDVLFPYARQRMLSFVGSHLDDPEVRHFLSQAAETINSEDGKNYTATDWPEIVTYLIHWIDADCKHGALKGLQGIIWEEGYKSGTYQGHVYADVLPQWKKWREAHKTLAIYSSGSVQSQKSLFSHSIDGDLTPFLNNYFDTNIGAKRETNAYKNIAQSLGVSPSEILFLSDTPEELDAAKQCGLRTTQILRPGAIPSSKHKHAKTFADVKL